MATGLRLDTAIGKLQKRLSKLKETVRADAFRPELKLFAERTLTDCIRATPVRDESKIQRAQEIQYRHRINYIPSVHELADPSLIVNDQGNAWVFYAGKWYNAEWRLPAEVFAAFEELNQERERRLETAQGEFIEERKQARFLYQKSWFQVAQSLGISIPAGSHILISHSRHEPKKESPKGYGQWRGGGVALSIVVYNSLLNEETRYWIGNGKQILAQAMAKNRARFYKDVEDKTKRMISVARQSA